MSKPPSAWRVYRTPLVLAVVSGAGLVGALLVEGAVDAPWTLAVAIPLGVIVCKLIKARR